MDVASDTGMLFGNVANRRPAVVAMFENDPIAARQYVKDILSFNPKENLRAVFLMLRNDIIREFADRFLDALRRAGLPENLQGPEDD